MSKKFWISMSIILIILLGISAYKLYRQSMEMDRYRRIFVNHLYYEVDKCILFMSQTDWDNKNTARDNLERITDQLQNINNTIEYAHDFMNNSINSSPAGNFMIISDVMSGGIIMNGTKICDGFLEDGKISENEKAFLALLEKDLQGIKNNMYSDETKQKNSKLTIKQINYILLPFFEKYREIQNLNLSNE